MDQLKAIPNKGFFYAEFWAIFQKGQKLDKIFWIKGFKVDTRGRELTHLVKAAGLP